MRDKDLAKYSCERIKNLFRDTKVKVSTYYNIKPISNGNYISIDVDLHFTIPERNIALLDNHLSDVRKTLEDLTEVD